MKALVFLFNAPALTDVEVGRVAIALAERAAVDVQTIEAYQLSDKDLVRSLVNNLPKDKSTKTICAGDQAAIYIGTKFADSISKGAVVFATAFSSYYTSIKMTGADYELVNAVEIITDGRSISPEIRAKYGLTNSILDIIKRVGKHV